MLVLNQMSQLEASPMNHHHDFNTKLAYQSIILKPQTNKEENQDKTKINGYIYFKILINPKFKTRRNRAKKSLLFFPYSLTDNIE